MPVKSHLVVNVCLGQDITQNMGLGLNSFITCMHAFGQSNHDWSNLLKGIKIGTNFSVRSEESLHHCTPEVHRVQQHIATI